MSKVVFHYAQSRGYADHGWLKSHHTFSFANYYNPDRIHFGALRVLNDDKIAPGQGFGTHPHDNMEIISIPLEGQLAHKDSMGNVEIISSGEIQVMSAGTGIYHSEYNPSETDWGNFLQIWIFPDTKNVSPRYDQVKYDLSKSLNSLQELISPKNNAKGLWIHQNAWLLMGKFEKGFKFKYNLHSDKNGVYIFVIQGSMQYGQQLLNDRDAIGIFSEAEIEMK
jgi:redox-sensitive bicupin YhaK (pirin superfamily)